MRRVVGSLVGLLLLVSAAGLGLAGCSAIGAPELSSVERAWCLDHMFPDPDGAASVAASARRLGIASPELEKALGEVDATYADGARLAAATVAAQVTGDAATIEEARAAYLAWQSETAFPAQQAVADAMGAWSTTPEWAEACTDAYGKGISAPAAAATPTPTPIAATPEPTVEPTPTPKPKPTPRLTAYKNITYTGSTSVGRLVELTIKVRNPGTLSAGKVSAQVEGVGYSLKSRTPMVGCVPNCRTSTGAEGITYVEWPAPAPGKTRSYTVQLKPNRTGTYTIAVRSYRGPAADTIADLANWTVKVRVR
jgi:hypothetical protein